VDLARDYDLLLVGMVRGGRLNVYAGEHLIG
jgi:formate dehydrogenase assembly factor FdhD